MPPGFLIQILFPFSTFVVMFGLGLALKVSAFRQLARTPWPLLVGLGNQLLLLPLLGFALALLWAPRPELAVGLIILTAAPGGIVSNILVHLVRGDTALSVTLTTLSSLIAFLTAPLWIGLALRLFLTANDPVRLPLLQLMMQIALLTVLPVLLGILVHKRWPELAARFQRPVERFSTLVLVIIVFTAVISERANLPSYLAQAGPLALQLNLLALGMGWVSARLLRLPTSQRIAIALETGIQNGPVALTIAATMLGNTVMSIPAATYAVLMLLTGSLLVWGVRSFFPLSAVALPAPGVVDA